MTGPTGGGTSRCRFGQAYFKMITLTVGVKQIGQIALEINTEVCNA
jgi:hypothetical protein